MINAILFDHDGVLVNSMPYHVQAWQEVMARHGVEIDPLEIYLQEGATTMEVAAELCHRYRKRMGIVTGSIRAQVEPVLGEYMLSLFDCLITADDVEYGKPDPEPYLRAARKVACAPSECLVIENAPLGIISAKAAGMSVIAITSTLASYHLRQADAVVSDFWELRRRFPGIVSKLEGPTFQPQPQSAKPERDFYPLTDVDYEEQ